MNWTSKVKKKLEELRDDDGYYVYEVELNRRTQEKYQFSSSTTAGIVDQISLFNGLAEYGRIANLAPSWKRFEDNFIDCFPAAVGKSNNWGTAQTPWGRSRSQRPLFKILYPTDPEAPSDESGRILWLIEFWPNREVKEESFLIYGYINDVIRQVFTIIQTIQATENLNHVLGLPVTDHIKRSPKTGLTFKITFSNYKDPPWYKSKKRQDYVEHQVSIPFIKRSMLNYQKIRTACGGSSGLVWGKRTCLAYVIPNGYRGDNSIIGLPQVWVQGDDERTAEKNLLSLLTLSDSEIVSITDSSKSYRQGINSRRIPQETNNSYIVYANKLWVENKKIVEEGSSINASEAKKVLLGRMNSKRNRFTLNNEEEPPYFESDLNALSIWS